MLYKFIKQVVGAEGASSDATNPFSLVSAASANATLVKVGPGVITSILAIGQSANVRYLKFYDIAQVPVAGQGLPCRRYAIPGQATGAGISLSLMIPMRFNFGIAFVLLAGTGLDTDVTATGAGDVILTLEYL